MTRIFEALRKSQGRPMALPFPPAEIQPARPAPVTRLGVPDEPAPLPRIDVVSTAPLPEEVGRAMTGLRIRLESALEGETTRAVMFLSAMPGEGVTTVANQFASSLASDGRGRCLLLDLHSLHPAAPPRPGVPGTRAPARAAARIGAQATRSERGGHTLGVAVMTDEVRRAGGWTPASVRTFLATVSTQFDWVIVDGPPVLQAPESIDLAPLVHGVVLVVRSGHSRRPAVLRAADLLRKSGVRMLGCVLNGRRFEIPGFIYRRI